MTLPHNTGGGKWLGSLLLVEYEYLRMAGCGIAPSNTNRPWLLGRHTPGYVLLCESCHVNYCSTTGASRPWNPTTTINAHD